MERKRVYGERVMGVARRNWLCTGVSLPKLPRGKIENRPEWKRSRRRVVYACKKTGRVGPRDEGGQFKDRRRNFRFD